MYDHIFARSFRKNEQKRLGFAFLICSIFALSIFIVLRPSFHLSTLNMEMSQCNRLDVNRTQVKRPERISDGVIISQEAKQKGSHKSGAIEFVTKEMRAKCSLSEPVSDHCEFEGLVRIDGNTSTIYIPSSSNISWIIRPYARKRTAAMNNVQQWTIKTTLDHAIPTCTKTHLNPALIFSGGGFSGNPFHAFSDVITPLFSTSKFFNKKVHLLITNFHNWWISKYGVLLKQLSDHEIVDIDKQDGIHCYQNAFIGLIKSSRKELSIDASRSPNGYSMKNFRDFLRSTYSLERKTAIKLIKGNHQKQKPRLMIISRKNNRRLTNEDGITKMAESVGFEVVTADIKLSTNLSKFAKDVNYCDVLMGVHGAGLTNMVFLPDGGVVIQVVPFGGIEGIANGDFGEPAKEMNLRYLNYSVTMEESSLMRRYGADDDVIRDPGAIHRRGWNAVSSYYLKQQDVKVDVSRFRSTLLNVLELLHHH